MTYKNTFQQGIAAEDKEDARSIVGGVPANFGVPANDAAKVASESEFLGVPMPGPGMVPSDLPPAKCVSTTRKGNPCKAYAVSGSKQCVGHNK